MFDIGFSEFLLIGVVALLVLGPERLPRAARTVGALLRRARNSWTNVRNDIERELAAEELKRSMRDTVESLDPRKPLEAIAGDIRETLHAIDPRDAPSAHDGPLPPSATPDPVVDDSRAIAGEAGRKSDEQH